MIFLSPFFKNLEEAQKKLSQEAFFLFDIHQVIFHRKGLLPFLKGLNKTNKKHIVFYQALQALLSLKMWKTISQRYKEGNLITEVYLDATKHFPFLHNELLEFSNNIYTPHVGIKKTFERITQLGHKMYLLSNIGNATLEKLKLDYPDYFIHFSETENTINRIISDPHIFTWKPRIDAYFKALSVINKENKVECAIFIDDKLKNVHAAQKAGLNAIKFSTQAQLESDLKKLINI